MQSRGKLWFAAHGAWTVHGATGTHHRVYRADVVQDDVGEVSCRVVERRSSGVSTYGLVLKSRLTQELGVLVRSSQ